MPTLARGLVCLLVPAFLLMSFHPRGWARLSTEPSLVADSRGVYFPSLRVLASRGLGPVAGGKQSRWLFVPWSNIADLREDKAYVDDGWSACAAFDVVASTDEVAEFFHDDLKTKRMPRSGSKAVAFYVTSPPRPRTVIAALESLRKEAGQVGRDDGGG